MSCFLSVIFGVIKYPLNDRFGRAGMGIFGANAYFGLLKDPPLKRIVMKREISRAFD